MSSALFDILCSNGFFTLLIGAISGQSWKLAGFAFVDNTDLIVMVMEDMVHQMQAAVAEWEALLSATDRALVPEKCVWYLVNFEFHRSQWRYTSKNELVLLAVCNAAGKLATIPQLPVTEAHRTLGVRVAPDGNNAVELEHLCRFPPNGSWL